jgi:hypothetical protein
MDIFHQPLRSRFLGSLIMRFPKGPFTVTVTEERRMSWIRIICVTACKSRKLKKIGSGGSPEWPLNRGLLLIAVDKNT